ILLSLFRRRLGCGLVLRPGFLVLSGGVMRRRLGFVLGLERRRGLLCLGGPGLLRFRLVGGLEMLAVEGDLGDAHRGERLAMSSELLILLLALVVEDQHFIGAAFFDHAAGYASFAAGAGDLAIASAHGQHVIESDGAAGGRRLLGFLHTNNVARRNPILFPASADDRVHKCLQLIIVCESSRRRRRRASRCPDGSGTAAKRNYFSV